MKNMKPLTIKKISQPSKGWGRIITSKQVILEGNAPYVHKIKVKT